MCKDRFSLKKASGDRASTVLPRLIMTGKLTAEPKTEKK